MSWSPQQDAALGAVRTWLKACPGKGAPQVFRLFGYAGTGKTTLAKELASSADGEVLFGAFTGKAAHVLHRKGCTGATTIHSMIYSVEDDERMAEPRFVLNPDSAVRDASLVIIDEVSMVGEDLGRDLLSFGTPILVLGDPAQLPPVTGAGFFTAHDPDVMLTEVHRQARDSAIIRIATDIREGRRIEPQNGDGARVLGRTQIDAAGVLGADQILVGKNATRVAYNSRIRKLKGYPDAKPVASDRLVCLRNDRTKKLLNGSLWAIEEVKKPSKTDRRDGVTRLVVVPDEGPSRRQGVAVRVKNEFWTGEDGALAWGDKKGTDEFTYGYALTVHKAQGSQWDSVVIFDESGTFREDAWRWLYTGVTRAAKDLTVVL